jgi:hypothetical protein
MRRKREVEFRPYTKESLLAREVEIFAGEDEEEALVEDAPETGEIEEGMHAVEDEAEPLDFSEEADGDAKDDDDDDDEDES